MQDIMTICNYCNCGCEVYLRVEQDYVADFYPRRNSLISPGNLCSNGWHLHKIIHLKKQLTSSWLLENGTLQKVRRNKDLVI